MGSVLLYRNTPQWEQSRVRSCLLHGRDGGTQGGGGCMTHHSDACQPPALVSSHQAMVKVQSTQLRRKIDSEQAAMKTRQRVRRSACTMSLASHSRTTQSVKSVKLNGCLRRTYEREGEMGARTSFSPAGDRPHPPMSPGALVSVAPVTPLKVYCVSNSQRRYA